MEWTPGLGEHDRARLWQHLEKHPAIPALRRAEDVDAAFRHNAKLVFFLTGTLYDLRDVCARGESLGMHVFCHLDLVQGIGKDPAGIKWLATEIGVRGVLTTRSTLIRAAKNEGLMAIQRLFMLDSESLRTGLEIIASSRPDAVEILPALVVPSMARRLPTDKISPFIAGGLVETVAEIESIMAAGALGVSTSKKELWAYERA
jgi:glycerol uptake operon antiterminator